MSRSLIGLLLLVAWMAGPAQSELVLFGSTVETTTGGTYTFDLFATANGSDQQILSFNLPLDLVPGVTASGYAQNGVFAGGDVEPLAPPFVSDLGLFANTGSLSIADGQTVSLLSIDLTFDETAIGSEIARIVDTGFDANIFSVEGATGGVNIASGFNVATAIPEPSGLLVLGFMAAGFGVRKRQQKRLRTALAR